MPDRDPPARGRRSVAKHDAILRAAGEVFLSEGYARASVDAIAAAAGVGKQTVYGHFGNKQQLFLAVVEAANRSVGETVGIDLDELDDLVKDSGDPRADLEATGERLVRAVTAPEISALQRLTIAEMTHHTELQRSWRDDGPIEAIVGAIAGYFERLDQAGRLSVPDPTLAARQFVMLLSVEGQVRSLRGIQPLSDTEVEEIARTTTDLLLRAHRA